MCSGHCRGAQSVAERGRGTLATWPFGQGKGTNTHSAALAAPSARVVRVMGQLRQEVGEADPVATEKEPLPHSVHCAAPGAAA